jgi:hypothetical protein
MVDRFVKFGLPVGYDPFVSDFAAPVTAARITKWTAR